MTARLGALAFAAGAAVLAWVGIGYASTSPLALAMTVLIAAVYAAGGLELQRFHRATTGLQQALARLPASPAESDAWLQQLHPTLQQPVRLRIGGARVGLPGPAMAPYLVGLLVLLGMLGTFLGMVVTLKGAATALQTSTDLPTIRAALTAPVLGLGLAFGTSVAGVAASAMLGLVAALCRRARGQVLQQLDAGIATTLGHFSDATRRATAQDDRQAQQHAQLLQALQALHQQQAAAVAALVDPLQAALARLGDHSQALGAQLQAGQESFHRQALITHTTLAASVEQSLQRSLADGARLAGTTLAPMVQAALDGIAREAGALQTRVAGTVQQQLDGVAQRLDAAVAQVAASGQAALADQQRHHQTLADDLQARQTDWAQAVQAQSAALLAAIDQRQQQQLDALATREAERLAALAQPLQAMAASLRSAFEQAGAEAQAQQAQICRTLEATAAQLQAQAAQQTAQTVAEVARLLQAAGEAPRAAAEAMGQLRQQLSDSLARDNALLQERSQILATLTSLLDTARHAATDQRAAIDSLVAQAGALLQQAGAHHAAQAEATARQMAATADQVVAAAGQVQASAGAVEASAGQVEASAGQVAGAATEVAAGAIEVASLGEAFGAAVAQFSGSNQALLGQLQRVEAALGQSLTRSDEQLAYYVAQAREIIDLSLLSQKQVVDDLQRLAGRGAGGAEPA